MTTTATNLARTPTELPGGRLLGAHGSGRETAEVTYSDDAEIAERQRAEVDALAESGRISVTESGRKRKSSDDDGGSD